MDDKEKLVVDLLGKSSTARRKACGVARASGNLNLCDELLRAYQLEAASKSWQTKVELLKTIGILGCANAVDAVEQIVFRHEPQFDMIKKEGALAWVRLKRQNLNDGKPVIRVIKEGTYSAVEGALEALGYDRMVPSQSECECIVELAWDFGHDRPKGYTDPRYGLAAACAGWGVPKAIQFLEHCLETSDAPLIYVASNAIKKNYVKLR